MNDAGGYEAALTNWNMRMASQNPGGKSEPSARAPQRDRGKARVAALMQAGAAVFAERGYDAATMTEVAARAGAAIGSLYQFFPTKALLAQALHAQQFAELGAMLDDLSEDAAGRPVGDLAGALFEGLSDFLDRHPAFVALADRRDIQKPHRAAARERLLTQLTQLLTRARPPAPAERAPALAMVILLLMKAMVDTVGAETVAPAEAVREELRRMLQGHLEAAAQA